MIVLQSPDAFTAERSVLALGMFDGVHIGHQALIRTAVHLAAEMNAASVVCTFDRHPLEVLAPSRTPKALRTLEENLRAFERLGADAALVQRFDRAFADMLPEDYVRALTEGMRARAVVAGENYTFGKKGRGDAALIRSLADRYGYRAVIVPPVCADGREVSSTWIRQLLAAGECDRAKQLLEIQ